MGAITLQHFPWAGICFAVFLAVCGMLLEPRFDRKGTALAAGGFLAAIASAQAALLLSGQDETLVLTLLPLTAYLPAIVGVHVLSRAGFFQTVAVWAVGAMASLVLAFLQKLLMAAPLGPASPTGDLVHTGFVLLAAAALAFAVLRWLRAPFRSGALHRDGAWPPVCLAALAVFLLLSYFEAAAADPTVTALAFLAAVSVFAIAVRTLAASASARRAREAERALAAQLDVQRGEYEGVLEKLQAGRAFRHDLRHHLKVLEGLVGEEGGGRAASYIDGLGAQLRATEQESYCDNPAANALLAFYLGQAREAGCAVTARASIPAAIPFDELDVCVVLGNALENALRACREIPEADGRSIDVLAVFEDDRLLVSVENPCAEPVRFGADGFPIALQREGHGVGLRSVGAVARKYRGLLRCSCDEGTFRLQAALVDSATEAPAPERRRTSTRRMAQGSLPLACVLLCVAASMPMMAQASEDVLGSGPFARVAASRVEGFRWGDTGFRAVVPRVEDLSSGAANEGAGESGADGIEPAASEPDASAQPEAPAAFEVDLPASGSVSWESGGEGGQTGDPGLVVPVVPKPPEAADPDGPSGGALSEGIDDINRRMEEYVATMRDKFLWYAARKYQGCVGMDVTYRVVRNDGALLSIRFDGVLNAGGSGEYARTFTLDKRTGAVLELADLFVPGADYVSVVSAEVLRQMVERVDAGEADYFVPGGIWPASDCFTAIDPDQHFYIDEHDRLVIAFDKYEIGPGKDGAPEFAVPAEALAGILRTPTLLG